MKLWHENDNGDLRGCTAKDVSACPFKNRLHYPAGNKTEAYRVQEFHTSGKRTPIPQPMKRAEFVQATPEEIAEHRNQKVMKSFGNEPFVPKSSEKARISRWEKGFSNYLVKERIASGEKGSSYADDSKREMRMKLKKAIMAEVNLSDEEKHNAVMVEVNRAYREDVHEYRNAQSDARRKVWDNIQSLERSKFLTTTVRRNILEKDIGISPEPNHPSVSSWAFNKKSMVELTSLPENNFTGKEMVVRFNKPAPEPKKGGEKLKAFFTDQQHLESKRRNSLYKNDEIYIFQRGSNILKLLKASPGHVELVRQKLLTQPDSSDIKEWGEAVERIHANYNAFPPERIPLGRDEATILSQRIAMKSAHAKQELAKREKDAREAAEYGKRFLEAPKADLKLESQAQLEGALTIVDSLVIDEFTPEPQYHKYPV